MKSGERSKQMVSHHTTSLIDSVQPVCSNCGGVCCGCDGNGLVLVRQVVDTCARCAEFDEIENGMQRAWCPDCGGHGLIYEELLVCRDCIGNGYCVACCGEGRLGYGI